ncbi:MAG: hypothetical protein FWH03_03495 [Firmicutes bacterium]|nr:hypothetical protein [Bacillota bacterium]
MNDTDAEVCIYCEKRLKTNSFTERSNTEISKNENHTVWGIAENTQSKKNLILKVMILLSPAIIFTIGQFVQLFIRLADSYPSSYIRQNVLIGFFVSFIYEVFLIILLPLTVCAILYIFGNKKYNRRIILFFQVLLVLSFTAALVYPTLSLIIAGAYNIEGFVAISVYLLVVIFFMIDTAALLKNSKKHKRRYKMKKS